MVTRATEKVQLAKRALREITLLRHFSHENITGLIDVDCSRDLSEMCVMHCCDFSFLLTTTSDIFSWRYCVMFNYNRVVLISSFNSKPMEGEYGTRFTAMFAHHDDMQQPIYIKSSSLVKSSRMSMSSTFCTRSFEVRLLRMLYFCH